MNNDPIFEVLQEEKKDNYGRFAISPLGQGYGQTLGNCLRRVLLTSLGGAAITWARIDGVKHQFSTLKGMKEDIVGFLLNVKKISFISSTGEAEKVTLSAKGPGEIKAKDIKLPATLKIANPDLVLANLNKGAEIKAEFGVESGVGYLPSEEREEAKIGVIPLDASFSPVVKVNYKVEETRVGRVTNYDKLVMDIWTNGAVEPKDALVAAAKIMVTYFNQIVNPKLAKKEEREAPLGDLGMVGKLSVEEIGLPTRVANALIKSGYETVEDLVGAKYEDLVKVRNLGEKSVKIVSLALAEKGVRFAPKGAQNA